MLRVVSSQRSNGPAQAATGLNPLIAKQLSDRHLPAIEQLDVASRRIEAGQPQRGVNLIMPVDLGGKMGNAEENSESKDCRDTEDNDVPCGGARFVHEWRLRARSADGRLSLPI
jgi:hypothetical protein